MEAETKCKQTIRLFNRCDIVQQESTYAAQFYLKSELCDITNLHILLTLKLPCGTAVYVRLPVCLVLTGSVISGIAAR